MAKTPTSIVDALEEEAIEQLAAVREFRVYKGENPGYRQRARLAIAVIGAYVRLRATVANERSNELIALRLLGDADEPKQLPAAPVEKRR